VSSSQPSWDQSISLEEVLSPEHLAEFREDQKSQFSIDRTRLKPATAAATREIMQRDFDAGKRGGPDE
jgi:hypothetical protein